MPRAAKRIKTGGADVTRATVTAPSTQHGIQAFGRISKAQPVRSPAGKSKAKATGNDQPTIVPITSIAEKTVRSKKRTAQHLEDECETGDFLNDQAGSQRTTNNNDRDPKARLPKTSNGNCRPETPRKKTLFRSTPFETPTKGASAYLESLNINSSPDSRHNYSSPVSRTSTPASSPPPAASPKPIQETTSEIPEEVQDLINLHSSFLTALSLHHAHHGSLAPADFRNLRPNIERSWRKRRVSIRDIQLLLALQQISPCTSSKLSLSDFGSSKICIEIEADPEPLMPHRQPLNEDSLNQIFRANLLDRWTAYTISQPDSHSVEDFVRSLPLAPITPCTCATAIATRLLKRQRRLEDHKAGALKTQARSQPKNLSTVTSSTTDPSSDVENIPPTTKSSNALARQSSLLDRIKQKQEAHLRFTALHAALTPSQVRRKAALRRIEEVVPVIELLSSSNGALGVKSFTMPTIVQHLQMSLRNPIEKEEAIRTVRLLAEEVAPEWVGIKEVGKVVGVVVRRDGLKGGREGVKSKVIELVEGL